MVANQMVTESVIEGSSERAARDRSRWRNNALAAHTRPAQIQLAADDVRLARTRAEVEKALADLQRHKASAAKELEAALAAAQRPEAKEQLQKTKALMEGFAAAVEDLAKAADEPAGADREAPRPFPKNGTSRSSPQMKLPAMQKLDNRLEIESAVCCFWPMAR